MAISISIAKIAARQFKQFDVAPPLALAAMVTVFAAGLLLRLDRLEETHLLGAGLSFATRCERGE